MPDEHPVPPAARNRDSFLVILMPWRYGSRKRQISGSLALLALVCGIGVWVTPVLMWPLYAVTLGLLFVGLWTVVSDWRDMNRYKRRDDSILDAWSDVLDGKRDWESLTGAEKEEINVMRAKSHLKRAEPGE